MDTWYDKHLKIERPYPHLICSGVGDKGNYMIHRCDYCGLEGDYNDVLGKVSCTERPKPCSWCGESPLCAPDCTGIALLLADPKVYVIDEVDK